MNKKKPTTTVSIDELTRLIYKRRRQITFDKYPKPLQEFLTRIGANPYKNDPENIIEYRGFTVNATTDQETK